MSLIFLDVANEDQIVKEWENTNHIYIVLDYNGEEEEDKWRDIIKFDDEGLLSIGWKGIYAKNITDAYKQLEKYLGDNKVKTIVLRSHGVGLIDANNNVTGAATVVDNNSGDFVSSVYLDYYENKEALFKNQLPDEFKLTKTFIDITLFTQDGGDFVVGSCHAGIIPDFLFSLHRLINYRINLYGIAGLSRNTYSSLSEDTVSITTKNTFSNTSCLVQPT